MPLEQGQVKLLQRLVNISLICLLVGALLTLMGSLISAAADVIVALVTAGVTWFCYRKANQQTVLNNYYYLWRYIPLVLFLVVPVLFKLLGSSSEGWSWAEILTGVEILISYIIPISLLIYVDRVLRRTVKGFENL